MEKMALITLLTLCLLPGILYAQQPESPLLSSFAEYQEMKKSSPFGLEWLSIGPVINSARVEAVQVDPIRPGTMYVAFGSGNLWKSVNNGLTWKPIFEDQPALGIGDIALAPSDPNIIYLGTGESLKKPRNFTMPGTGVYKSEDGGITWKHCGMNDSWHIGEISVHPTNPDIVFVAVLGHFWSQNVNRGVYRTTDGGIKWEQVLFIDEHTGANDVVISPSDPNTIYVTMWHNYPGISGENSGVFRSTDGGSSWKRLSNGFPQGENIGRIGVAVSWSDPKKVYALVDNLNKERGKAAEVYKSLDGGASWKRTHDEELMIFPGIGWYFADIYVNPVDDEEIYALGVRMAHSANGGKNFDLVGGDVFHIFPSVAEKLHLDHCELWIHPENPDHLALGNDGGLFVSYDKGGTWMHYNNIPSGEFYDITVDRQNPYKVYGGTQDDATVSGPAQEWNQKYWDEWEYVWIDPWSGGDGCVTQVDPADPNTVYFSSQNGAIRRKDMTTDLSISIRPRLPEGHAGELKYNFVAPYFISVHDRFTLYQAGNYVFKSVNRGDDWELISSDLSISSDPEKTSLAAGAIAESPVRPGLIYLGTDKGAFWVSRNGGTSWEEHSKGLPNNFIRSIFPSKFKESRVYITLTGINYDDLQNYIYVSENYGENWRNLKANLPNEIANVIYEDPIYEEILYAGLYRGVYCSFDRGETWSLLGRNLAASCISDLIIQEDTMDLVAGTHGRGIYKINLKPVHEAFKMGFPLQEDHIFTIPKARMPLINDTHPNPDNKTVEKVPITFWMTRDETVTIKVINDEDDILWSIPFKARTGFNQYRWDLVTKQVESPLPYFIHYKKFVGEGCYRVIIETSMTELESALVVTSGSTPNENLP